MKPVSSRAIVGIALGAATGILVAGVGSLGAPVVALVVAWSLLRDGRRFALGGLLAGFGGIWLALLGFRTVDPCGSSSGTCVAPDLLPFVLAALVPVVAGGLLMLWALRSPRSVPA
jgi:hypothetical protein